MSTLLDHIASDPMMDQAYVWLCAMREHYHHNADVWHLRHGWREYKPALQARLRAGQYRLGELCVVRRAQRTSAL